MNLVKAIVENLIVVLLAIGVLIVGMYAVLLLLDKWLKMKSGSRELEGLTVLMSESIRKPSATSLPTVPDESDTPDASDPFDGPDEKNRGHGVTLAKK